MSGASILVIDDDSHLLEVLTMRLESAGHAVVSALTAREAVNAVKEQVFDLSIIDLQLADTDGIALMEKLRACGCDAPVIILTAHGSFETAVEAVKRGAFNYLSKPFDAPNLLLQVERALEHRRLDAEVKRLHRQLEEHAGMTEIITKSPAMKKVLNDISKVAATNATVYIHGESGTGKELVARAIYHASPRKDKPFVAMNCAAIPETLMERELFGHMKGSFTGADRTSKGLFSQADDGTLFLDEIGDMPLSLQAKLLRVLQERRYYVLGSEKPTNVDVRVITATNKDLENEVKEGRFREDLFYRIHVIPIVLPPLRDRKEDIPLLATHFLYKISKRLGKEIKDISPGVMQKLMSYDWPGNIRELENTLEYAIAMTRSGVVSEELVLPSKGGELEILKPLKDAKDEFERDYIIQALKITAGNVTKAASLAGKYRADFYNLLKKYRVKADNYKKI